MKNKLLQLFRDNSKAAPAALVVKAEGDEATVYLYDAIGGWYGIDAQTFAKELAAIDAKTIHLRINSPGGDVFEARAMQTALKQHSARIIAHIDGLAASAATYIATGADEVEISDGAFFMIHNAWTLAMGNANDLEEVADMLRKVDGSILRDYQRKTGQDEDQLKTWMDEETWFTAEEAKEHGFVDRIFDGDDVDNSARGTFNLAAYNNAPAALTRPKSQGRDDEPKYNREMIERRLALVEKVA